MTGSNQDSLERAAITVSVCAPIQRSHRNHRNHRVRVRLVCC